MRLHARFVSLSSLSSLALLAAVSVVGCMGGARSGAYPMSPSVKEASYGQGVVLPEPMGNTEQYTNYGVNPMKDASESKLSTFAVDVDTASYSIVRRKLREGTKPPKEAVRAEEFLNAFDYGYEGPSKQADAPFAIHLAAAPSPFDPAAPEASASGLRHTLVRVAIKGKSVSGAERKAVHLVYLVDTSGSMMSPDKIDLAKKSLHLMTDALHQGDTVALCTYAGSVSKVLDPTGVENKQKIHAAIDQLTAGGSTAMASGIDLAYSLAHVTLKKGDVNRVIVLSDGDANVGTSNWEEMYKQIEQYKDEGITLSTVGFGNGNYKDTTMEQLADKGDGNYSYIDDEKQAKHVFVDQLDGLLQVIARDVKVQVEFDPEAVKEWRLIGYENRAVANEDFRNDKVDGGEIGAGHSVTALYDVVLKKTDVSPLRVSLRWKKPLGNEGSKEIAEALEPSEIAKSFDAADARFRLAVAVAGFAEVLRESDYAKSWSLDAIEGIAKTAKVNAAEDDELVQLIELAKKT